MTQKRSRLEVYLDILKVISNGTHKPTRIMYGANLSWKPLMKALESMLEQGLINADEKHATYTITEKGRDVLHYFDKAVSLIQTM